MKPEEMHKALFVNLIMMLGSSAMQQLGKLVNPATNKTETNIEGAQVTIDMIEMLQAKTKGNLDKDEDKMVTDLLSSLQMNFVETSQTAAADKEKQPEPAEDKKDEAEEKPESDKNIVEASSDPKDHKSCGE